MATSTTRKTATTKVKAAAAPTTKKPAKAPAAAPAARRKTVTAAPTPVARAPGQPALVQATKAAAKPAAVSEKSSATKKDAARSKDKPKKVKMVRDSFTMPEPEYKVLGEVKRACLKAGVAVKKSELLRAGVALLQKLKPDELNACLSALAPIKAGRPKAGK